MPADEPLSAVDTAWLRMDRPTNLMMICGLIRLDGRLKPQAFKEQVRERLLRFHRLRQRVQDPIGDAHWESDPAFDLDWHVQHHALGRRGLEQAVSELVATPLDPARPMWQFHQLDRESDSVIVLRIHHCYADGFALLHIADALTDLDPATPRAPPPDVAAPAPPYAAWERMLGAAGETVGDAMRGGLELASAGIGLVAHPARALDAARAAASLLYQAGAIAAMGPDAPTRLKGELGTEKRAAWAGPLPLPEVKAVAATLCCSVNDVLVACVAGALRGYLLDQGDTLANTEIRALVPVNLRPPGPPAELGNRFGLVFLGLPVAIADPVQRALAVHERMQDLKQSQQPLVALGILAAMGVAPRALRERLLEVLAANATLVLTNVHGQDSARYLAGRRIAQQMFWVPQAGGIGLGASIFSYDGQVNFGLVADALRVPDPAAIARRFPAEFEALLLQTLMMPWPAHRPSSRARRLGR
jgi:WS/DGAT/MGAT family acyltransferase